MEVKVELVLGWLASTVLVGGLQVEVLGRLLETEIVDCDPGSDGVALGLQRMNHKLTSGLLLLLLPHSEGEEAQVPDNLPGGRRGLRLEPDLQLHRLACLLQVVSGQFLLALLWREDNSDLEQ